MMKLIPQVVLKGEEFGFYERQLVTDDLLQTSVFLS